ncbi:scavenger receptor class B member 1-like [Vanessa cardui]|uniref:scavenger receptor class B member 1-like n=1 Tax=Vanessa cardui TaxID=171605 RepID=UPI001F143343|nr:scavenger receptor class B member 1-like [Vanessa cardui]
MSDTNSSFHVFLGITDVVTSQRLRHLCKPSIDIGDRGPRRTSLVLIAVGFILLVIATVSVFWDTQYQIIIFITRIAVGSKYYEIFARENAGTFLEIYVFNVTNAEAFLSGEDHKLRIEEVGPFTYQEYRKNEKFEIDEEAGVMRYIPRTRAAFRHEQSIDDPACINITVPNPAMLAISSMVSSYPYWTKYAFTMLTNRLKSKPIINIDVHSLLWGFDEPLIALSNTLMPGWITFSKMGIMDRLYDQSSTPVLEVSSANLDKFQVKKSDGYAGLKVWNYGDVSKRTRCNTFVDTYEGYAYAPRMARNHTIRLYRSTFCRMFDLSYIGVTSTEVSSEAFVYQISNNSYALNTNTECLCGQINECIEGISDISPCLFGLTIALSNAHFLYANPKLYDRIEGIRPDEMEHGSEFVIEPKVGAVISGRFTIQVNVIVNDVDFYSQVKPFSKMVVPLAYFKIIQPELSEKDKTYIKISSFYLPYIVHGMEALLFIIGLTILVYGLHQMYQKWRCYSVQVNNEIRHDNLQVETPLMDEKYPISELKTERQLKI